MAKSTNRTGASVLNGGKVWFIVAIAFAVLASGGVFYVINSVAATTTYYVLNRDVSARTLITTEMMTPVTTSLGGQPRNALTVGDVSAAATYSKFELNAGDILSTSNAGALSPITAGVPEDFVVASFQAPPENSVAGRVKRGDYIDIISVGGSDSGEVAKYVLRRVLVLDVNASLASASTAAEPTDPNAAAADSAEARTGAPTLYTVALPKQDAVTLALVSSDTLFIVLSSVADAADEDGVDAEAIIRNKGEVYLPDAVGDSGIGTDNTFGANGDDAEATEEGAATEESAAAPTPAPSTTTAPLVEEEPTNTDE